MNRRKIEAFQKFIFNWWKNNRRDLPWRHTHDPYKILVSEIMLQQTQVVRVIPKYKEFLNVFPTRVGLARASAGDVLRVWKGMGYNRRALYLKKAAQQGILPKSETELIKLPGVGKYTARAILVFAYKQNVAAVDTNIRKIIIHYFFNNVPQQDKVIQNMANSLLPKGKSWEWHQALMDYGALAMPNVKSSMLNKKKAISFAQSNRFYRGKIIDLLRVKNRTDKELLSLLVRTYNKPEIFFRIRIEDLIKEGLVEKLYDIVQLPR